MRARDALGDAPIEILVPREPKRGELRDHEVNAESDQRRCDGKIESIGAHRGQARSTLVGKSRYGAMSLWQLW